MLLTVQVRIIDSFFWLISISLIDSITIADCGGVVSLPVDLDEQQDWQEIHPYE